MKSTTELAAALAIPGPLKASLRQAVVQSVQATTLTIRLGGGTTDIAGVHYLRGYFPAAGDTVWVVQNGPDLLVINAVHSGTAGISFERIATAQGTTSDVYNDLPTVGPSVVSMTTGTVVKASLSCWSGNSTINCGCLMTVEVTGATTITARDIEAIGLTTGTVNNTTKYGLMIPILVNRGVNNFVCKYKRTGGGGTATFLERTLVIERVD